MTLARSFLTLLVLLVAVAGCASPRSEPVRPDRESAYAREILPVLSVGYWTEREVLDLGAQVCSNPGGLTDDERVQALLDGPDRVTVDEARLIVDRAWTVLCPA